jgi:hypothetical protein
LFEKRERNIRTKRKCLSKRSTTSSISPNRESAPSRRGRAPKSRYEFYLNNTGSPSQAKVECFQIWQREQDRPKQEASSQVRAGDSLATEEVVAVIHSIDFFKQ